jgi:hypothetical protein
MKVKSYRTYIDSNGLDCLIETKDGPIYLRKDVEKVVEEAVNHLIGGLITDGGHHKQWDMEQALLSLMGEEWVEANKWVDEGGEIVPEANDEEVYERWEPGIPA